MLFYVWGDKMNDIGKKIKTIRKKRKMTQVELAKKAGIATISLQQYESGKRIPATKQLIKIANAFEMPLDFFNTDWESQLNPSNWKTTEKEREEHEKECRLLQNFKLLNSAGKEEAIKRVNEMLFVPDYTISEENEQEVNGEINHSSGSRSDQ